MSRRSSRLASGGYNNADDESDPNLSSQENSVRVFKKKARTPKASHTSSRANNNASSSSTETSTTESMFGCLRHPLRTQSEPIMRTVPFVSSTGSPQPGARSQRPRFSSLPSSFSGLYRSSRPALHLRPNQELSQNEESSSGYLSSEDTDSKSTASNSLMSSDNEGPSAGYGSKISHSFFSTTDLMSTATNSEVKTAFANDVGLRRSSRMKKAFVVSLPMVILLLAWSFLLLLNSFISSMSVIETHTQEKSKIEPVDPAVASLNARVQALEASHTKLVQELSAIQQNFFPAPDKMVAFALETQGAIVTTTRCSVTYRFRPSCVTLFGFPLWYLTENPRTVVQDNPVLAGKCWPFHGGQGALTISLSHPIKVTHVTLDHLPHYNSPTGIESAPKDFDIYGMKNEREGTLLGTFTYDKHGEPSQTFKLLNPSDEVYKAVELRVLSNWGNVDYTCLYRLRVHGNNAN